MRSGSAPRARGTPCCGGAIAAGSRVSPACAGNTATRFDLSLLPLGQPRVRGEHLGGVFEQLQPHGSAPRARGTPTDPRSSCASIRVSPACAGNTFRLVTIPERMAGQPRVRGEHRDRGEWREHSCGSAPRARGTLSILEPRPPIRRVSPACAGNTRSLRLASPHGAGQPRVRGEHAVNIMWGMSFFGSAPRARGTLQVVSSRLHGIRVSPACAGNTSDGKRNIGQSTGQPRVRGEHRANGDIRFGLDGSAPRARGTRIRGGAGAHGRRVSPACAGNTNFRFPLASAGSGQPRVRGEHSSRKPLIRSGFFVDKEPTNYSLSRWCGRRSPAASIAR